MGDPAAGRAGRGERVKIKLTSMQQAAFSRPCFLAEETTDPNFSRDLELDGCCLRVRLTANIGEE